MGSRIKLLLIEDDKVDQLAFERVVERQDLPYTYLLADSVEEARHVLAEEGFDLVLADYILGDGTVFELFDQLQDMPFIIMTGGGDEEIAVRAMKAGAYDYVTKDPNGHYLTTMPIIIQHAIERWKNKEELERYRSQLEELVDERTAALRKSEQRYRTIFQTVPISVWEEDFSVVIEMLDDLRAEGVTDIESYLEKHPEFVKKAFESVWIRDVNDMTLDLYGADDKEKFLGRWNQILIPGDPDLLYKEMIAIYQGKTHFEAETKTHTLQGKPLDILVTMTLPNEKQKFESLLVSIVDITQRKQMEEELRRSEERYRTIFETTGTATVITESDMTISLANAECARLTGYSKEALKGKMPWTAFVAPKDLQRMKRYHELRRRGSEEVPQSYEFELVTKNGDRRKVYLSVAMIPNTEQSVASILDITDRVLAGEALEKRVAQLGLINEIGAQIVAELDLARLMDRAAELIQETFGYQHVGLFLLNQGEDLLHLQSKAGDVASLLPSTYTLDINQGVVGWVARNKKRLLINDVKADERYINLYPATITTRSELSVPIWVEDELVGVLDIQSPQREAFDANDVLALETLADQIAISIENAELHETVQKELQERERTETALRESQRMLSTLMSNLPGMAYRCHNDEHWTMEFISEGSTALTGYAPEDLVENKNISYNELILPEDRNNVRMKIVQALQKGTSFQLTYRIVTAEGERRWVWEQGRGIPTDDSGDVQFLEGFITDITDRKQAERDREAVLRQLEEQTERLQQIMNTVSEGMLLLDADKRIVLANPVAKSYLEVLGDAEEDDILHTLGSSPIEAVLTKRSRDLWHEIEVADHIFEVAAKPLVTEEAPTGWTLVLRDVTREREMQQRMQQQERLAAIGQLAAGIAHDFNNIMAIIVLYADMMLRSGLPSQDANRLRTIIQQANHASDLIDQLLDFSRRAVFERRPMDLGPFLKEQVKLYKRTLPDNIDVQMQYSPGGYYVNADPTRIQQVVMNLVVNARDAMPDGGQLYFELSHLEFTAETVPPLPDIHPGDWIQFRLRDTGVGMSEEVRTHLFEPFFTTKKPGEGSGLGLAQVFGIVKKHEGEIVVTSEVKEGTTFDIYLPALSIAGERSRSKGSQHTLPKGRQELILVVEDSPATRDALTSSLEMLNYRSVEATNGLEALRILDQRDDIALVLSDMLMQEMGGAALLQAMETKGIELPIILLSGHPQDQKLTEPQATRLAYTWLAKPVGLEILAQTLVDMI
jgi:PAS domain S-box-containing protein